MTIKHQHTAGTTRVTWVACPFCGKEGPSVTRHFPGHWRNECPENTRGPSMSVVRSDPWRYVSPCCRSTCWRPTRGRYQCRNCGDHFEQLRDKKNGELVV